MTQREEAVCHQCGHQFRTGTEVHPENSLNRTMQFVLPPLQSRLAAVEGPEAPVLSASLIGPRRLLALSALAISVLAILVCLGGVWLWHTRTVLAPLETSPTGVWETTLRSKASSNAHLEFAFEAGGTGRFSWRESGPAALSGQTPLHWQENSNGTLFLALVPPVGGDSVSQTLTGIFSRPAWPLRVDRTEHQLVLGTLVFTEKQ